MSYIVVPLGSDHCDFCRTRPVAKLYRCKNFEWEGRAIFSSGSTGLWAACQECSELVETDQWSSLTENALREFVRNQIVSRHEIPSLWAKLTGIHRLFAEHMIRAS